MGEERLGAGWQMQIEEVVTGMREWRTAHPQATFAEIEAALDERLARLRARLLEEAALASRARTVGDAAAGGDRLHCPDCGHPLHRRGEATRTLTVHGDQPVVLRRHYATCPACGTGLFPPGRGTGPAGE